MSDDRAIQKAREEIAAAVRFLPPYEIEKLFKELAAATEGFGHRASNALEYLICN